MEVVRNVTLFGRGKLFSKVSKTIQKNIRSVVNKNFIKEVKVYKTCYCDSILIKCFNEKGQCDDSVVKTENDEYSRVFYILQLKGQILVCGKKIEVSNKSSTLYVEHLKQVIKQRDNFQLLPITAACEKSIFITTSKHCIISSFPNDVERY